MIYNGGIYGIPIPRSRIGTIMFTRDDNIRKKGLNGEPKSFAEFRELCKGLTDKKANKFAIGRADTTLNFVQSMLGKPNTWIQTAASSPTSSNSTRDGGAGSQAERNSSYAALVGVRKGSKADIKNILALCNWLAAPFGAEEFLERKFGVADTDYTLHGSDPVLTDRGTSETALPVNYLVDSPDVIYDAGDPALAKKQHAFFEKQIPMIVPDPSVGLYSNTDSSKGPQLNSAIYGTNDTGGIQSEIFQGRKTLQDWDEAVKTWRSSGGNTIKAEYEKAYEQLHGH